uniref:Tetratricopeptide repeat family protein n=1 Tax=Nannochloropsis gaditana (strain CCMP526) TaxID=1093141 RepID=I2CRA6_NANGC
MEKSAAWYMKALEHNPKNAIAAHALGALGGEKLEGASLAYLAELFDSYSATFDASLHALEYKSPELLRRAVDGLLQGEGEAGKAPEWRVMDAGCGTGLSGLVFRNLSQHLLGVDVSRRMVQKAQARAVYDELVVGDMAEELLNRQGTLDLVVSADVLVYMGRLEYIVGSVGKALKEKGLFAFTLEAWEEEEREEGGKGGGGEEGWLLRPTGRYAHRREYVEDLLEKVGLGVLKAEAIVGRRDKGEAIKGWLFLCQKR